MALNWGKVMFLVSMQEFDTPMQFIIVPLSSVLPLLINSLAPID